MSVLAEIFLFLSDEIKTLGDFEVHQGGHEYTTVFDFCTYSREIIYVFPD